MNARKEAPAARTVAIDDRWQGFDGVYGGYLLGLVADEACRRTDRDLASVHCVFTGRVRVGSVDIASAVDHEGRRTTALSARLRQGGVTKARATAIAVPRSRVTWLPPHDRPPAPETFPDSRAPHAHLPFAAAIEQRGPGLAGRDHASDEWMRLRLPYRELGLASPYAAAAVVMDNAAPGLFATDDPPLFVPTVEFDLRFVPDRAILDAAVADWIRAASHSEWVADGLVQEQTTLAARDGRPFAHVRQLRTVLPREEASP